MHVTLGEAARQSGISKSTISRAIKDGKLSAVRSTDTGSYRIEQSELARYLDATAVARATVETGAMTQSATPMERPETAALEAQIDGLKQVAELLRAQLTDALSQRDRWQQQAERLAVLPAPQPPAETPARAAEPAEQPSRLRRTWKWLRSTG
jgi:excisionase family DNA binding protein